MNMADWYINDAEFYKIRKKVKNGNFYLQFFTFFLILERSAPFMYQPAMFLLSSIRRY